MDVKSRREEYTEATRRALLDAAADLFATSGYAATSIEDVVGRARVTRGALYHHFRSKEDLFEAVYTELEEAAVVRIAAAAETATDSWSAALGGVDVFFDLCLEERYRRIVIVEGPLAFGPRRWRELSEQHSMGLVRATLAALMDEGRIRRQDIEIPARIVFVVLSEAALGIAEADDRATARRQAFYLVRGVLDSLR
jgi:AcrR family transcriptional regulator